MKSSEQSALQKNLQQLQLDTFSILLMTTGIGAWLCFSWAVLPDAKGAEFRSVLWLPCGLLLIVVFLTNVLRKKHYTLASLFFLMGLSLTIILSLHLTDYLPLAYLLGVVIVFAGVLLKRKRFILLVLIVILALMSLELARSEFSTQEFTLFTIILCFITIATWVSTYSLQIALTWTLSGYEQARKNEAMIRQQKLELLQTMAQLDTAMQQLMNTNQRLHEARLQAEESRKLKQQFAQTISHELRTPLNLIVGFTETMVKSPEYYGVPLPNSYARDLSIVYRNASHLQNMVNDVLDLARMEKASMELILSPLDLAPILEDALETIGSLIKQRGLDFEHAIDASLPPVLGDAVRLKQVMLNLLNNAIRFTEQGLIIVRAYAQDLDVLVCVEDTGIGIPENRLKDIFEPFHQLDSSLQRQSGGTGLGLSITQHLVELHGGKIWAESHLGIGSKFYFSLPIPQDELPTMPLKQEFHKQFGGNVQLLKPLSRESLGQALKAYHPSKNKVLIVDDNLDFIRLMQGFLLSMQREYRVMGAASASEASLLIKLHQPDIVLLDLHLPDKEGLDLIDMIRLALPQESHLVLVSAYDSF